jgi:hypothetical protein
MYQVNDLPIKYRQVDVWIIKTKYRITMFRLHLPQPQIGEFSIKFTVSRRRFRYQINE